jgi:hypothetical protein
VLQSSAAGRLASWLPFVLRLRGIEVTCYSLRPAPHVNRDLVEELGGAYVSPEEATLTEASGRHGPFDLIFEATGFSPIVFEAA